MASSWEQLKVDDLQMYAYVSRPDDGGQHPGVVVFMEAFGLNRYIQRVCDNLAREGYIAIVPDLFHRQGTRLTASYDKLDTVLGWRAATRDDELVQDADTAIDYLKSDPEVLRESIGILGFCMGGRVAYLIAGSISDLRAAVVFYGGSILKPFGEGSSPFQRTPNINCPLLGIWGDADEETSVEEIRKIQGELKRNGKTCEFHVYAGGHHGFHGDDRPWYHPEAAKDAWAKTLNWLQKYLKNP